MNYKAISFANNFDKLLENFIHYRINKLIRDIISHSQHGYMTKRSTVRNLAAFVQYIADQIDKKDQVAIVKRISRKHLINLTTSY